ncbi:hypothetical protein EYC59_06030 [Candidatus Saccharibacteria bacterium]|nr:MAG: hypothetical protein EYC59_06030 [Candidatus Saccharibacteria bacterium]
MKRKIGLYSGTFGPIHEGHIAFALAAIQMLELERVMLLPERHPRGKMQVTPFDSRLAAINDAIAGHSKLALAELQSAHHTVESVRRELHDVFASSQVVLLMGSDVAKSLQYWDGVKTLLRDHELCIGLRNTESAEMLQPYMRALEDLHDLEVRATYIMTKFSHISSTAIRQQAPQPLP